MLGHELVEVPMDLQLEMIRNVRLSWEDWKVVAKVDKMYQNVKNAIKLGTPGFLVCLALFSFTIYKFFFF